MMKYKPPKGLCDICEQRKATHWFGQTSVALCDHEACARQNLEKWQRMLEEEDDGGMPYGTYGNGY